LSVRFLYFATEQDIAPVLRDIDAIGGFKLVLRGLFDEPAPQVFNSLEEIPSPGRVESGDAVHLPQYLVLSAGTSVNVRSVPQRRGGTKYAIDQIKNPDTISFQPGGVWTEGILVRGELGTASHSSRSASLYRLFRKPFRKRFTPIQSCLVGDQAALLLDQGWRLTHDSGVSTEYDLRR
jgi:hypothetical protein